MNARQSSTRGLASILALVTLSVLTLILASVLQHNALRRGELKREREAAAALSLADSGVDEALHRLAASPEGGRVTRTTDRGGYEAVWRPLRETPGTYEIVSRGRSGAGAGAVVRIVRAKAAQADAGARLTAWEASGEAP